MKKIFASLLILFSLETFATTTAPVQMLNPTGSTIGQAIVSTGASTAPSWSSIVDSVIAGSGVAVSGVTGNVTISIITPVTVALGGTNCTAASGTCVDNISGFSGTGFLTRTGAGVYAFQSAANGITLGNLTQIGANTVLANATGAIGNISAFSMPSCSTSAKAIGYTSNTGFTCNTSIAAATLTGATSAVVAGNVGELQSPAATTGTNVPNNTSINCASASIPAGIWDITGSISYVVGTGATVTGATAGLSTTSATVGTFDTYNIATGSMTAGQSIPMSAPLVPFIFASTTTVYLVGGAGVSGGTATCNGRIVARRAG